MPEVNKKNPSKRDESTDLQVRAKKAAQRKERLRRGLLIAGVVLGVAALIVGIVLSGGILGAAIFGGAAVAGALASVGIGAGVAAFLGTTAAAVVAGVVGFVGLAATTFFSRQIQKFRVQDKRDKRNENIRKANQVIDNEHDKVDEEVSFEVLEQVAGINTWKKVTGDLRTKKATQQETNKAQLSDDTQKRKIDISRARVRLEEILEKPFNFVINTDQERRGLVTAVLEYFIACKDNFIMTKDILERDNYRDILSKLAPYMTKIDELHALSQSSDKNIVIDADERREWQESSQQIAELMTQDKKIKKVLSNEVKSRNAGGAGDSREEKEPPAENNDKSRPPFWKRLR